MTSIAVAITLPAYTFGSQDKFEIIEVKILKCILRYLNTPLFSLLQLHIFVPVVSYTAVDY